MSTIRHFTMAALVVIAGATPVLCGCPSTSTSVAPRPATAPTKHAAPLAAPGDSAVGIVPVAFVEDGPWQPSGEARPPITLQTADGGKLALRKVKGRSVVQGPLAFTELELSFDNPENRVVEGRFRIALPSGAVVSRFGMRIHGRWQEAEMVERKRARKTFEDFLHRKQDPALLEQAAGNEFSARVFPIPARSTKELIISYSQELTSGSRTLVPLRGLPEVAELDLAVVPAGGGRPAAAIRRAAYSPTGDFAIANQDSSSAAALRNGELVVARIRPPVPTEPDLLTSAVVLVDSSASRALGLSGELRLLERLAAHVASRGGAEAPLAVAGFDQVVAPVLVGKASEMARAHQDKLAARGALGASDFRRALRWAGKTAKRIGARRVVLITDGVATAGPVERAALRKAAAELKRSGVARLDAIVMGGIRDDDALRTLVTAGLERDGVVVDGELPLATVVGKLDRRTSSGLPVSVPGSTWSWPKEIHGVQAGDQVIVYAELPAEQAVRISVGGTALGDLRVVNAERPLLERSWASAKIASLLDGMSKGRSKASAR